MISFCLASTCVTRTDQHLSSSRPPAYDGQPPAACLETFCSEMHALPLLTWAAYADQHYDPQHWSALRSATLEHAPIRNTGARSDPQHTSTLRSATLEHVSKGYSPVLWARCSVRPVCGTGGVGDFPGRLPLFPCWTTRLQKPASCFNRQTYTPLHSLSFSLSLSHTR